VRHRARSPQIYRLCTTFHEDSDCCMDMVSGEVLEGLKGASSGGVHNNGGLIVTFLIDDDHSLIIAPQVGLQAARDRSQ